MLYIVHVVHVLETYYFRIVHLLYRSNKWYTHPTADDILHDKLERNDLEESKLSKRCGSRRIMTRYHWILDNLKTFPAIVDLHFPAHICILHSMFPFDVTNIFELLIKIFRQQDTNEEITSIF